ncbi:MAG TPA: hypothetical protein VLL54_01390 [Pyrinomonadaceae bacterium]|nr:hypothetical protein [Pyrinomonadaceae bacterium]
MKTLRQTLIATLLVVALTCGCSVIHSRAASPSLNAFVLGTWTGESICVGNRPACKNEVVVYRFEEIAGKPAAVTMLADKIIQGKREPMGKLECQYDESKGTVTCEFTIRQTHGLWQYQISGDTMEGTLVLLPNKEVGRRVKVKRVDDKELPAAPDRKDYDGD